MHMWYECKIRYEKTLENGLTKKVTEPYLVDALSHTEAEARIIEEVKPFVSGEFEVVGIRPQKISELFSDCSLAADSWFKFKIAFLTLDEKTGQEKKTFTQIMQQASDARDAIARLDQNMKGMMADYSIVSLTETAIIDVYPYTSDDQITEESHEE